MIEIENLYYIYNYKTNLQFVANSDINLFINSGEVVGLVGATGSGKSTFLKQIAGILKPTKGKIKIKNESKVGFVFQKPENQLFADTVYDDIAFGPLNKGISKDDLDLIVKRSIEFVGLKDDILKKSPFDLSGGEKRRVAIAGIIAMKPEILILDEPTAGLDLKSKRLLIGQLKNYQKEKNTTMIIVSHDMDDILNLCDKVIVMQEGRVIEFLTTKELFFENKNIEDYKLELPHTVKIARRLKSLGYEISCDIKNINDLEKEILSFFGGN